ncbi:MAG: 2-dehydro-3-deoxygalactonokinase [Kordiimonadaceae bacterium]|jgi:2-dehydro-3-deoxygalactonokinase|nr:2-dehydro-3-deoxygalactonokinase [Kordiimonadaceae bacterium]MBT6031682.1 2-dehydro-3-deoxygalactonokinase [Kordiimonadaceae bacterium]
MTDKNNPFICADWGTSNLRVYLMDGEGSLLEEKKSDQGLLAAKGKFQETLGTLCQQWFIKYPTAPVYLSGMIGSREGWVDARYLDTPYNLQDLPNHLIAVPDQTRPTWVVPGVRHFETDNNSADIMRGEETQILGAIEHLNINDAIFILPGTHSKWVQISNRHIMYFNTYMTGEMYNIIKENSILRYSVDDSRPQLNDAFIHGVDIAQKGTSLLNQLFTVRTSDVLGLLPKESQSSHLSGILIGQEVTHARAHFGDKPIHLIGSDHLTSLYQGALEHLGHETHLLSGDIAARAGLNYLYSNQKNTK